MTPSDFIFWQIVLNITQFVITTLLGLYVFVSNRNRAKAAELMQYKGDTDRRISDHTSRLAVIEETVRCAPNHGDIGKVHGRLDAMSEQLSEARGELKAISKNLGLIHQFLLNQRRNEA